MSDVLRDFEKQKISEGLMHLLDAEYDENGDIRCMICGRPNECCRCEVPQNHYLRREENV